MNRRDFLKYSAAALLGVSVPEFLWEGSKVSAGTAFEWEPPIQKRFFQFTEYEKRSGTEFLVIHHTGFPKENKDATAADIHKLHQEANGWAGIGYHYLIRKSGMIEQGRQPGMVGAHAYHYNKTSIGICLAGNFEIGKPTGAQMKSLKILTAWLCRKYNLNPMKKGVIVGHRDLNDTDCPGRHLYRQLGDIRRFCRDAK